MTDEYKCPQGGGTMKLEAQASIPGAKEPVANEAVMAIINLLGEVAQDFPEQSVTNAKLQAAIKC